MSHQFSLMPRSCMLPRHCIPTITNMCNHHNFSARANLCESCAIVCLPPRTKYDYLSRGDDASRLFSLDHERYCCYEHETRFLFSIYLRYYLVLMYAI